MVIDAPLSVCEAGFSLHAATRAGPADEQGRQALLKYILRPPRFHPVRYFGVLASASKLRPLIVPKPRPSQATHDAAAPCTPSPSTPASPGAAGSRYRPWAELLKRTFAVDVQTCPGCGGRMRLLAVITDLTQVARFLHHRREPTEPPARAPPREPPYFKTLVVRRRQPTDSCTQRELFEEH